MTDAISKRANFASAWCYDNPRRFQRGPAREVAQGHRLAARRFGCMLPARRRRNKQPPQTRAGPQGAIRESLPFLRADSRPALGAD